MNRGKCHVSSLVIRLIGYDSKFHGGADFNGISINTTKAVYICRYTMLHDNSPIWMATQIPTFDAEPHSPLNDDLADVFGSEPASPSDNDFIERHGRNTEWSDIPRLREKHETEGYRDGVTKGKAESVQKGFDEGYGLGAVLGLRVGKIVGLLEGICAAIKSARSNTEDGWGVELERLESLLGSARLDLKTESVFGRDYFDTDGIWRFAVEGEEEGREVLFPDVARSHPLIQKWEDIIAGEVRRWSFDLTIMDNQQEEKIITKVAAVKETGQENMTLESRKGLNW